MTASIPTRILFHLSEETLDAILADIDADLPGAVASKPMLEEVRALVAEEREARPVDEPAGPGLQSQGMQWMVLGMVPGPVQFMVAAGTRAEALAEMAEQSFEGYEYAAVVKARDFFALG